MSAQIGGGGVFASDKIIIDGIVATRRRMQMRRVLQNSGVEVEWHVQAPEVVMVTVASLVATVRPTPYPSSSAVGMLSVGFAEPFLRR